MHVVFQLGAYCRIGGRANDLESYFVPSLGVQHLPHSGEMAPAQFPENLVPAICEGVPNPNRVIPSYEVIGMFASLLHENKELRPPAIRKH